LKGSKIVVLAIASDFSSLTSLHVTLSETVFQVGITAATLRQRNVFRKKEYFAIQPDIHAIHQELVIVVTFSLLVLVQDV
jgi:hypothetical protein